MIKKKLARYAKNIVNEVELPVRSLGVTGSRQLCGANVHSVRHTKDGAY